MSQNCKLIPAEPDHISEYHSPCGKYRSIKLHFKVKGEYRSVSINDNTKEELLSKYSHEKHTATYANTSIVSIIRYWIQK